MKSFKEHIELNEDTAQIQKAQKTLKSFAKTLADKGWEVGEIKENDPDNYGQLLTMSARKEKYPEPSDFRDSSMVLISVDVRFRQTRGQRASSSISSSVYQKQKWQKVSMAKFWEYVNAVENEKEFKDRKIKELQTAHRKGRISDEDFADSMKLYEEKSWKTTGHYTADGEEWNGWQHVHDGQVMTGKTHSDDSVNLYHFKDLDPEVQKKVLSQMEDLDNACWTGYQAIGTKKKGKKTVPNCVPIEK